MVCHDEEVTRWAVAILTKVKKRVMTSPPSLVRVTGPPGDIGSSNYFGLNRFLCDNSCPVLKTRFVNDRI